MTFHNAKHEGGQAVPARTRGRTALRVLSAGAASCALAGAMVVGSVADLPWNTFAHHPEFEAPAPVPEPVEIVGAATSSGPQTIDEVLQAVERAESAALDAGLDLGSDVQQAAAELGSLLVTYVAQERAVFGPPAAADDGAAEDGGAGDEPPPAFGVDGLDAEELEPPAQAAPAPTPDPAPSVDPAPTPDPASTPEASPSAEPSPSPEPTPSAEPRASVPAPRPDPSPAPTDGGPDAADQDTGSTVEVSPLPVPDLGLPTIAELGDGEPLFTPSADPAEPESDEATTTTLEDAVPDAGAEGLHEHEAVSFDDVVLAATNLITLLDPAAAPYQVSVTPALTQLPDGSFVTADGTPAMADGSSLSAALASVVAEHAGSTAGYLNGKIPTSALCSIDTAPGHLLRCDAAAQFAKLNAAYRDRFGVDIPITDSYRSYESQVAVRAAKPHLAAVPGTSNHGWGLALDLSTPISSGSSAEYVWLRVNAPDYGWDNPTWARPDGRKPEPWHWEFFAAGPVPDRAPTSEDVVTAGSGTGGSGDGSDSKGGSSGQDGSRTDDGATDKGAGGKASGGKDEGDQGDGGTTKPSPSPSAKPSPSPSPEPSTKPTPSPSPSPSPEPSAKPSPSPSPSAKPSPTPTPEPTPEPTEDPSSPAPADPEGDGGATDEPTSEATSEPAARPDGDTADDGTGPDEDDEPEPAATRDESDGGNDGSAGAEGDE